LAGAVKYKPLKGERLRSFLSGKADLEPELHSYLNKQNEGNILIINIESTPALEALDDILSVEGLDGILVGPHDLSCSLGIPEQYQHPLFRKTIETIIDKARSKQVGVGIHVWDAVGFDQEIKWIKRGANLVVHSNDLSLLSSTLRYNINNIKTSLGQSVVDSQDAEPIV
jgi:4-hydroxy-2-oxoheptanedioate aldolase